MFQSTASKRQGSHFTGEKSEWPSTVKRGMKVALETPTLPSKNPSSVSETAPVLSQALLKKKNSPLPRPPQINTSKSSPKIAIIISSMYDHIAKMAEASDQGVEKAGGQASIFQIAGHRLFKKGKKREDRIAETLSPEILAKMLANDLMSYVGYLFGFPTRYGNMPAQWKENGQNTF
ncbi:benzoquinone reductase [Amanita muscaria Koide BX008]|uniref:Benzoquinone reductase n=1 Tax=Amanita muscaria (strain Koide BX008) TaxID=946122 RepID=A0A0C2WV55_AMAMK|nr:benzoquinone reductase [Amanita muscaria Koide BX008]